jgi:hypothetical protein
VRPLCLIWIAPTFPRIAGHGPLLPPVPFRAGSRVDLGGVFTASKIFRSAIHRVRHAAFREPAHATVRDLVGIVEALVASRGLRRTSDRPDEAALIYSAD